MTGDKVSSTVLMVIALQFMGMKRKNDASAEPNLSANQEVGSSAGGEHLGFGKSAGQKGSGWRIVSGEW